MLTLTLELSMLSLSSSVIEIFFLELPDISLLRLELSADYEAASSSFTAVKNLFRLGPV